MRWSLSRIIRGAPAQLGLGLMLGLALLAPPLPGRAQISIEARSAAPTCSPRRRGTATTGSCATR